MTRIPGLSIGDSVFEDTLWHTNPTVRDDDQGTGTRAIEKEHGTKHSVRLTIGLVCLVCLLSCVQATDSGEVSGGWIRDDQLRFGF